MKFKHLLCATSAFAGLVAAPAAAQQAVETGRAAEPSFGGGDIIVTAQKRAENVQDVPLAVSVLGPAQLAAAGATEFQELGKVAPSLVVRPANHPVNANVSLRGVGTSAFSIGVEPSVAVLIDEVPLPFQARAFTDLPDVERIEVLRGPQSTLYGKSASAGLINIITRNPTDVFEGRFNARATTDEEYAANFTVSGPLVPALGYVVSGSYSTWDGNVRNITLDKQANSREAISLRGKLRWEPTFGVALTLAGSYNEGESGFGSPFIKLDPNARFLGIPALTPGVVLPGVTVGPNNREVVDNTESRTDYNGRGGYLRGEFDLSDSLSLISITSYDRFTLNDVTDQDQTAAPTAVGTNVERGTFNSRLFTQELRLMSSGDGPLRYTIGAYYADTRFNRPFQRGPAFSLAHWFGTSQSRQIAAFVQADYEILPSLTFTGGARVQNERIEYTFLDIQNGNAFFTDHASDTAETYRASLLYEIAPDVNVFATHATGYKGQTYDLTTGFNAARAAAGPVAPETSKDWELGVRSQFFGRRLTANITLFDVKYKNLQAQSIETVGATQFFRLTNVGGITTRGVEVDLAGRPMPDLNLAGSVTYLDATYTSFPNAQCYLGQTAAQGCTGTPPRQDLTGERVAQAPEWKFTVSGEYDPSLTDDLRALAQFNWTWQSDINYGTRDPQSIQPDYHIVNLGLGLRAENRAWELVAFVNNLFDQQYYPALTNRANFFAGAEAVQAILPRDFRRYGGLRLGLNF